MARLPQPGGDTDTWGNVLNDFLSVEHNTDGTLKSTGSLAAKADNTAVVHNSGDETVTGVKTFSSSPIVPLPTTNTQIANKTYVDSNSVSPTGGGGETYFDAGNSGAAATINLANGNIQKITLTAGCTITLASPPSGAYRSLMLFVFQDAAGSRTITWPASVHWGTAGAPVLSTVAGKMDKILLDTVDGGTTWYGAVGPGGY
jgi:hypothetical protein